MPRRERPPPRRTLRASRMSSFLREPMRIFMYLASLRRRPPEETLTFVHEEEVPGSNPAAPTGHLQGNSAPVSLGGCPAATQMRGERRGLQGFEGYRSDGATPRRLPLDRLPSSASARSARTPRSRGGQGFDSPAVHQPPAEPMHFGPDDRVPTASGNGFALAR